MIEDYFGARQDAAQQRNWDYIGRMNEQNRELQRKVIDGRQDAHAQKKGRMNRAWNDVDRKTALRMYKQGNRVPEIADFLGRDQTRVFDELQSLIAMDALGVKKINKYMTKYRAIPKIDLRHIMESKTIMEWMAILGTTQKFYYRLKGADDVKDVPVAVAINLAICTRRPVDEMFEMKLN